MCYKGCLTKLPEAELVLISTKVQMWYAKGDERAGKPFAASQKWTPIQLTSTSQVMPLMK